MPTAKQTTANRANSQKSTGPRTAFGKAASRFNALKHGIDSRRQIMFTESAEDLAELAAEYHEQFSPTNPAERFLVDTLVSNEWRLRRLRCVEADLWVVASNLFLDKQKFDKPKDDATAEAAGSGDAFVTAAVPFERLQRVVNSCERSYHRALKELQRLQSTPEVGQAFPLANPEAPQPQQSTPTSATSANLASFRQKPQTQPAEPSATAQNPELPSDQTPADPAEGRPSASDSDPKLPEAA